MDSYNIQWKKSAKKELRNLEKQIVNRIFNAVEFLADNPYLTGVKKLIGSDSSYRIRVGEYRIIYSVLSKVLVIEIIKVGHRQNIYKKL